MKKMIIFALFPLLVSAQEDSASNFFLVTSFTNLFPIGNDKENNHLRDDQTTGNSFNPIFKLNMRYRYDLRERWPTVVLEYNLYYSDVRKSSSVGVAVYIPEDDFTVGFSIGKTEKRVAQQSNVRGFGMGSYGEDFWGFFASYRFLELRVEHPQDKFAQYYLSVEIKYPIYNNAKYNSSRTIPKKVRRGYEIEIGYINENVIGHGILTTIKYKNKFVFAIGTNNPQQNSIEEYGTSPSIMTTIEFRL